MALEKDFLKKAKRDIKVPSEDLKAKIEADDATDSTSIEDVLGTAAEKPAEAVIEEKPAGAAPEKVEAVESTEKPEKKAKPEKEEGGDKVPVHVMVEQRKRADAAERRQRELEADQAVLRSQLEEARKPKVEPKKELEDPEPDREKKPIEWSEWRTRELGRENAALREQVTKIGSTIQNITQREEQQQQRQQFSKLTSGIMDAAESGNVPERIPHIPDFKARYEHIRGIQIRQNQINGLDAETAGSAEVLDGQLAAFIGQQVQAGKNWVQSMSELADTYGYVPKAKETAKPTAAPKAAIDNLKDKQERAKASVSSATMPGAAPKASSDEDMNSDKWVGLTPKERSAYKRAHPDFKLDRIMADA